MKRFLLLVLIVLFTGLFVGQLLYRHLPESDPLELVDRDCALLIDLPDAVSVGTKLLHSRFGRDFTSINWLYVFDQLDFSEKRQRWLKESLSSIMDVFSNPLWRSAFTRRLVVAFIPSESTEITTLPEQKHLVRNMVVIASSRMISPLRHLFSSLAGTRDDVTELTYRGRSIFCLSQKMMGSLYYAVVDGHVVISPAQRAVEKSIDLSLRHVVQNHTGLITKNAYQDLRNRYKGDDVFVYADIDKLAHLVSPRLEKRDILWPSGMKYLAFFHAGKGDTQRLIAITRWDEKKSDDWQSQFVGTEPAKNGMLPEIPSKLVLYFWTNWLDLTGWWKANEAKADRALLSPLQLKTIHLIEESSGLGMDEFVTLFGHNFGLNISGIRTSGFFPVPSISCSVEVTNVARVDKILQKSLANLPLRHDSIAGVPVVSVMIANGLMQPSYAFLGNVLLIADSREQIEELLDPHTERLVNDGLFKVVDTGMTTPSNLHVFARTSAIIESLKELATWGGAVIAVRDGAAGRKWKVVIDQIVLPLLDGFKTFQAKGVRGYTAPGEVVFDAVVQTADVVQAANKQ